MASNPTPDNNDILRALADRLADGCHKHEATLGIVQNTEARIRADILPLDTAKTNVGLKKIALDAANTVLQTADDAGVALLDKCKRRLRQKLTERWSVGWEPTGFPDRSTKVPDFQDQRFTLLKDLKNYFTAKPEIEDAVEGVTAAACEAAWEVLSTARQGVANAESAMTDAFNGRTSAENALRARVRGLINELGQLLGDSDSKWEDFGLNIPGNPSAPESVASVTLEALSNHRLGVAWEYATRAIRFRVETFIVGVDEAWQKKGSFKDLETILKGFTAGQVVKVRVVAGNDGGDAAPSPEAEITVT